MVMNREKIFQLAKGFRGRSKNCIRIARASVEKALQYAYISRKLKKRDYRSLWITRISAGAKEHGMNYSTMMYGLKQDNIQLNKKMISELAMNEPYSFKAVLDRSRDVATANGKLPPHAALKAILKDTSL
ncbi:54S ribosomal protein L20 mitochondrial [Cymbomonas tetramitiformis]|uniref:50S ribosomal protein L20 n=1 Tax=Cymbomonas tetramitiformis TaxID=36881 RepID=A0AAE0ETH6_9CHLO|nr:54S ribosomal protein L20 mitochondrial [Cymbomonas tetramitiformis]